MVIQDVGHVDAEDTNVMKANPSVTTVLDLIFNVKVMASD